MKPSSFAPGDIAILNDPFAGGTHLPDISMVLAVFCAGNPDPVFYVANRAHHADVGGKFPGSMGPATTIFEEGVSYFSRAYRAWWNRRARGS